MEWNKKIKDENGPEEAGNDPRVHKTLKWRPSKSKSDNRNLIDYWAPAKAAKC